MPNAGDWYNNTVPLYYSFEDAADQIQFTAGVADNPATEANELVPSSFSVGNTPGAALPSTGGPGTNMIYLFGIMLTGFAGFGFVMKRRRRNAA